jgi:hypothetical protein
MNPRQIVFRAANFNYRYKISKKQNMKNHKRGVARISIFNAPSPAQALNAET